MTWECQELHIWDARFDWMKHDNSWCPYCAGKFNNSIELCRAIAIARGGICLSDEYINNKTKMKWKCRQKHEWNTNFDSIKRGSWCPSCSPLKSELFVRKVLENLTGKQFPKVRPEWLLGLELDGYCEDEKLAFEYQGQQHYEFMPFFHASEEEFTDQQNRDFKKKAIVEQRGIGLIEIPYTYNYTSPERLERFVEQELQFAYAKQGTKTESDQIKILDIQPNKITYLDKKENINKSLDI